MSIQTELTRIINAKAAIKTAVEGKGVTVPAGTLLDGMASLIESIEAGGGGGIVYTSGTLVFSRSTRCSGYELPSDTSTYVGCVLSGSSGNQNKLYTKGNLSGFTFITLEKEQTLSLHVCVTGNITHNCISNDNSVNMLIAKIN